MNEDEKWALAESIADVLLHGEKYLGKWDRNGISAAIVTLCLGKAEASNEAHGWRPIESAPKDGTWIVLWSAESGISPAYWGGSYFGDEPYLWLIDAHRSDYTEAMRAPTHWMPLPAPPIAGDGEGGEG